MDNIMQNTMKERKYVSDLQYNREYIKGSCFILLLWNKVWVFSMCIVCILNKSLKC